MSEYNSAYTGTQIDTAIGNIGTHMADAVSHITETERTAWNGKQNALTFDSSPASGSANPVTSGGVYSALAAKAPASHTHDDRYYTESEVDTALSGKAPASHNHDDRYYTESEVDSALSEKAPAYSYGTSDLTAGSSSLETGKLYFVYE